MPEEKNYINGMIFKEKVFDNGGSLLKLSIKVSELIQQLEVISDNDWANLIISRRKEPSDKGITHYAFEDTWKPDPEYKSNESEESKNDEDLPF